MLAKIREFMLRRRTAYRMTFQQSNPHAQYVLADLRKFCRAEASTMVVSPATKQVDPYASAVAEGRREVWLRIMAHIHMNNADIRALELIELNSQENEQ